MGKVLSAVARGVPFFPPPADDAPGDFFGRFALPPDVPAPPTVASESFDLAVGVFLRFLDVAVVSGVLEEEGSGFGGNTFPRDGVPMLLGLVSDSSNFTAFDASAE